MAHDDKYDERYIEQDQPEKALDINYAINLPVIDMIFGTFYMPENKWPDTYGIRGKPVPRGIIRQQMYPFSR